MSLELYVIDGGRYSDLVRDRLGDDLVAYWRCDDAPGQQVCVADPAVAAVTGVGDIPWSTYYLLSDDGGRHVTTDVPLGAEFAAYATMLSPGEAGAIPNDVQLFAAEMTWSGWVRIPSSNVDQPSLFQVLGTSGGVFGGGGLLMDASDGLVWRCRSSTPANFDTTITAGNYPTDEWFHLAVTRTAASGGTVTMYVNGVQAATATGRTLSIPSTSSYTSAMLSGFAAGPTVDDQAALAHIAVFSSALSVDDIEALASTGDMDSYRATQYVEADSLRVMDYVGQRSTCDFVLKVRSDLVDPYRPLDGAEVIVVDTAATAGDDRVFAGFIDTVEEDGDAAFDGDGHEELLTLTCACVDYTELVDRHVVIADWENVVSGAVALDLVRDYLSADGVQTAPGFIEDGPVVTRVVGSYVTAGSVLDELAGRTGMSWFIDYYRRLRWYAAGSADAPFDVLFPERVPGMVPGLDPIAWYRLGANNAIVDSSGNGRDGTSTIAWGANPGALPAEDDDGSFPANGSSAYGYVTYAASLDPQADGFAVGGWIKPSTVAAGTRTMVSLEDTTGRSYVIRAVADAIEGYVGGTSGANQVDAAAALTVGVWSLVVLTYDGETIRLFVDGVLVDSSVPSSVTWTGGARPLRIAAGGTGSSPSNYAAGSIDEVFLLPFIDGDMVARLAAAADAPSATDNIHRIRRKRARTMYRNRQYVKGGTDTTDLRTESFKGDGEAKTFVVAYPVKTAPTITLNAGAQTVGVKGVDTGRDWYWSEGSTEIVQEDGDAAHDAADTIAITYRGTYPITVVAQNADEIDLRAAREGTSGLYENVESANDIDRSDMATERAEGLLRRHGTVRDQGTIATSSVIEPQASNLRAGQVMTVDVPRRGISGDMLVERVSISSGEGGVTWYEFDIVSEESTGSWADFFRRLALLAGAGPATEGDILVYVRNVGDAVVVSDTFDVPDEDAYAAAIVDTAIVGYSEVGS